MNDLIKIEKSNINGADVNSVNARTLWDFLQSKQEFSAWIKNRIKKYGFIEFEDFLIKLSKTSNGRPMAEYIITLDMAKELAMVENNIKGRQARQYFIKCEKELNKKSLPTHLETARLLVQTLEEKEQLMLTNKALEKQNTILMHTNNLYTATELAKELNFKSANALNLKLQELGIQYKVNKNWVLYSKYADCGYVSIKQHILDNDKVIYDRKFTQTGRDFILKLLGSKI